MEIEKRCQWCGKQFIAHKMTTLYCSSTCVNKAYKAKKRQMKKEEIESEQDSKLPTVESIGQKPFLSPKEAAYLLGISLPTIYRYMAVNNRTDVTVKFPHHVKNITERGDFLRFYA